SDHNFGFRTSAFFRVSAFGFRIWSTATNGGSAREERSAPVLGRRGLEADWLAHRARALERSCLAAPEDGRTPVPVFRCSPWLRMLILGLIVLSSRFANAEPVPALQHIPFPDARFAVYGLPWFNEDKPALRRLPLRLKDRFRAPVWELAQDPSG